VPAADVNRGPPNILHMTQQTHGFSYGRSRRPDTQVLFAIRFADGTTAYMRGQPKLATYGASPAVTRLVKQRQVTAEVPGGDIVGTVRVK
jgi:hypothetical protein